MKVIIEEDVVLLIDEEETCPDGTPLIIEISHEEYQEMLEEGLF